MFNWLHLRIQSDTQTTIHLKAASTGQNHNLNRTKHPNSNARLWSREIWRIHDVLPDKNRGDALLCSCSLGPRRHTQCSGGRVVGILLTSRPNWIIFLAFFLRRGMDRQWALYAKQARVSTSLRVPVLSIYIFFILCHIFDQFSKLFRPRIHPLPITSPSLRLAAHLIYVPEQIEAHLWPGYHHLWASVPARGTGAMANPEPQSLEETTILCIYIGTYWHQKI